MIPKTDKELLCFLREHLFSAVIGDVMDQMGLTSQFLPPQIRPLAPDMRVVGRAMPVLEADISDDDQAPPFGRMLEALDDLKPDEVYVCAGASPTYALWGELMSVRARKLGAAGAVLDGYIRDTEGILHLRFPTFAYGSYAQDQAPRGKVVDFRTAISLGGVRIHPGDIIVGDRDGVCLIPQAAEQEVIARAWQKASGEQLVRKALMEGMSAVEAFKTYGIM